MNFRTPVIFFTLLVLTSLTAYWGARAGSALAYGQTYSPRFFVATGFTTPGQGYDKPVGSGWPPKETVDILVYAEPLRDDNGGFAGTSSTWRSVATYTTDDWGSFGYIPATQNPVAGNICGAPPQGLIKPLYLARNNAHKLLSFVSGENSIYFTFAPCPTK
jgi:hypothetical protein